MTTGATRCPVCGAPSEVSVRPFCTARCSNVDLLRWLRGGYAIEGREDAEEDGVEQASPADAAKVEPRGAASTRGSSREDD